MLQNFILGINTLFYFPTYLYLIGGVMGGMFIGALPGFTSTMGIAVLLPLTFRMTPINGILTLVGIYVGGIAGGLIPAITLNIPGTPASTATTFDGYILTKKGRSGEALTVGITSSAIGGLVSASLLISIAPQLAKIALNFGSPEYFALGLVGITIVVSVSSDNLLKGLMIACIGFFIATIGTDCMTGIPRFNFGNVYLQGGISYGPLLIGLFGLSEAFTVLEENLSKKDKKIRYSQKISKMFIEFKTIKELFPTMIKSSLIGSFIGSLPGAGADIASFTAYDVAKRTAKNPKEFGRGTLHGVAASEAGNNSDCGGAMIPMLTFGIPGDSQTALLLAALVMQGIKPGPQIFEKHPDLIWSLFVGFIFANIVMFFIGILSSKYILKIINQPSYLLYPSVIILSTIGSYAMHNSIFDIIITYIFGFIGYFMKRYNYPLPPMVLAIILAPMVESELRRALIISKGNFLVFFSRLYFVFILLIGVASLISTIYIKRKSKDKV